MALPTPKHYWNFDKSSGLSPKDAIGGVTMRIDRADFRPGKDGKADTCLRFNSGPNPGARLVTTDLKELSSPTWTASMWIKREEDTLVGATLLSSSKAGLKLEQYKGNHKIGVTRFNQIDRVSEEELPLGVWAHLVFVGTASDTTLYIDGQARTVLDCSIQLPLEWVGCTHGYVEFGAFWLDELQIFDEALTAGQVKELYDEPSKPGPGVTPALQLWAWGQNGRGQLGNGSSINGLTPKPGPVFSRAGIKAISAGYWFSLALLEDGTVWAWGYNSQSELGNGDPLKATHAAPVAVSRLAGLGVKAISAGNNHSLALLENGAVWGWGANGDGQLGTSEAATFEAPEKVSTLGQAKVIAVAAGHQHSLALLENGTVLAWGKDSVLLLGNGTSDKSARTVSVPIPSSGGRVKAIAAGDRHSLALLEDGTVWAWGANNIGQLGNAVSSSMGLVKVSGLNKPVIAIAADGASSYSLALLEDGTVWAWGANHVGQLGNGTTSVKQATPVQVSGLTSVKAIAAGGYHGMALLEDGTVWVWGSNQGGQVGDGSTGHKATPVQAVGLRGIKAIAAGGLHSLAVG